MRRMLRGRRAWTPAALAVLMVGGVALFSSAGATVAAGADQPAMADTAAAALEAADASGQEVLVTSLTSKQEIVYAQPDGTLKATLSSGPAREPDTSAPTGWTPVNTRVADVGTHLEPAVTDAPMTFSDGGTDAVATLDTPGATSVTEPAARSLPSPTLDGASATYRDVYPGVDLVLTAQTGGFEQSWVITQKPTGPLTLELPLALRGLSAVMQQDGSVGLVDRSGDLQAEAAPAVMWDAAVDPQTGGSAHQETLATTLVKNGAGDYELQVTPGRTFLDAATYPVTVDPTSSLTVTTDTYIDDSHLTGTFQNNAQLKAGKSGLDTSQQLQRSLLSFPTGSLAGATIQSATLSLFEEYSGFLHPDPDGRLQRDRVLGRHRHLELPARDQRAVCRFGDRRRLRLRLPGCHRHFLGRRHRLEYAHQPGAGMGGRLDPEQRRRDPRPQRDVDGVLQALHLH